MHTRLMTRSGRPQLLLLLVPALLLSAVGCGKGWQLDYGKPEAQFTEASISQKGGPYIGKKVTVKGVVARQDLSDTGNCRVYLGHGICCNLKAMKAMAQSCQVGETVYIDGFLRRCQDDDVLLEPAIARDPTAPFTPIE